MHTIPQGPSSPEQRQCKLTLCMKRITKDGIPAKSWGGECQVTSPGQVRRKGTDYRQKQQCVQRHRGEKAWSMGGLGWEGTVRQMRQRRGKMVHIKQHRPLETPRGQYMARETNDRI